MTNATMLMIGQINMKKWFEDINIARKIRDGYLVIVTFTVMVCLYH